MRKYKVYVRLNREVFEIWENNKVIYRYEQDLGYALCDFINIDIDKLWSNVDKMDLLKYSQVFLINPQKSEYQYISDVYEATTRFISQGGKSVDCDLERAIHINIANVDGEICRGIYPTSVSDILIFLLYEIVEKNIKFKKCKRCNKYFPCLYNKNIQFCDRLENKLNKICREIKFNSFPDDKESKRKADIMELFKCTYERVRHRVRKTKEQQLKYRQWSKEACSLRDKCINGEITIEYFREWLYNSEQEMSNKSDNLSEFR